MDPVDPCAPPDLRHLRRLTDGFGLLQHTARETPQLEFGYALDDVARALIVVLETTRLFPGPAEGSRQQATGTATDHRTLTQLANTYLTFIEYCQQPDGRFHNFVAADRTFQDDAGSLDSHGRTLWALGTVIRNARTASGGVAARAQRVFSATLPHVHGVPHLRAKAFALLGLLAASDAEPGNPELFGATTHLIADLFHAYADAASDDWPWFEDALRYSNGALPFALLAAAGNVQLNTRNSELAAKARAVGRKSLDFLLRVCMVDGVPAPVGNRGWYPRGGERALYDQQCVDSAAMVVAAAEAFRLTADARYRDAALTWWQWFFGGNTKGLALYRPEDGAVCDGLTPEGVNENRGAESVVTFLLAHLALADTVCTRAGVGA